MKENIKNKKIKAEILNKNVRDFLKEKKIKDLIEKKNIKKNLEKKYISNSIQKRYIKNSFEKKYISNSIQKKYIKNSFEKKYIKKNLKKNYTNNSIEKKYVRGQYINTEYSPRENYGSSVNVENILTMKNSFKNCNQFSNKNFDKNNISEILKKTQIVLSKGRINNKIKPFNNLFDGIFKKSYYRQKRY